jgi:hypothetical protein
MLYTFIVGGPPFDVWPIALLLLSPKHGPSSCFYTCERIVEMCCKQKVLELVADTVTRPIDVYPDLCQRETEVALSIHLLTSVDASL